MLCVSVCFCVFVLCVLCVLRVVRGLRMLCVHYCVFGVAINSQRSPRTTLPVVQALLPPAF
jgi:hypothetical protein